MQEEWLTYAEAGERLGLAAETVRERARRYGITLRTRGDGKRLVPWSMVAPLARRSKNTWRGQPPLDPRVASLIQRARVALREIEKSLRANEPVAAMRAINRLEIIYAGLSAHVAYLLTHKEGVAPDQGGDAR